jgi:hypothetical protein
MNPWCGHDDGITWECRANRHCKDVTRNCSENFIKEHSMSTPTNQPRDLTDLNTSSFDPDACDQSFTYSGGFLTAITAYDGVNVYQQTLTWDSANGVPTFISKWNLLDETVEKDGTVVDNETGSVVGYDGPGGAPSTDTSGASQATNTPESSDAASAPVAQTASST